MLVFLRFDLENFGLERSGRSVGFISTYSGTLRLHGAEIWSKNRKFWRLSNSRLLKLERNRGLTGACCWICVYGFQWLLGVGKVISRPWITTITERLHFLRYISFFYFLPPWMPKSWVDGFDFKFWLCAKFPPRRWILRSGFWNLGQQVPKCVFTVTFSLVGSWVYFSNSVRVIVHTICPSNIHIDPFKTNFEASFRRPNEPSTLSSKIKIKKTAKSKKSKDLGEGVSGGALQKRTFLFLGCTNGGRNRIMGFKPLDFFWSLNKPFKGPNKPPTRDGRTCGLSAANRNGWKSRRRLRRSSVRQSRRGSGSRAVLRPVSVSSHPSRWSFSGHWKATGRIVGNFAEKNL